MKDLILRHYNAIKKRGLIDDHTRNYGFLVKLDEEYKEFLDSCWGDDEICVIDDYSAQECMDMVAVIFNMLIHNGYDIEAEFRKNVEYQESRVI